MIMPLRLVKTLRLSQVGLAKAAELVRSRKGARMQNSLPTSPSITRPLAVWAHRCCAIFLGSREEKFSPYLKNFIF